MITLKAGNLFEDNADILGITVNCVGTLGKGIAFQAKQNFKGLDAIYKELCRTGELKPGQPYLINSLERPLLLCPTKDNWRDDSEYQWIELILERLAVNRDKYASVALPPLGCGNGNLQWARVLTRIINHLGDLSNDIRVYPPPGVLDDYAAWVNEHV